MKLNKKILAIVFITFVCFLGINGVKAETYVVGTCTYTSKINGKDVSFKLSFKNDGTVMGGDNTKNGTTNPSTGDAIWTFRNKFDSAFFNYIYTDGKVSSCPSLRICSTTNMNVDLYVGTDRICSDSEEEITANGTFKAAKGSTIITQDDVNYCSVVKELRNKNYQIKVYFYSHKGQKMFKIERADNSVSSASGKATDYITFDGYSYSLDNDVITKYFDLKNKTCTPLYLKATVNGTDTHISFQTTKPADVENGAYSAKDAKHDTGDDYITKVVTTNKTIELVKKIYNTIKFIIPLLIIILSIIDFIKVLANGEDKVYKEAWNNFVKRVIIGIVFFLIPTIVSILLNLSGILGIYNIDSNNIFYIFK